MTLDNSPAASIPPLSSLFQASPSQPLTLRLGLFATLIVILLAQYIRSPWRKVPPGPKGLPILGNAHIMYLNALGQPIVILHSLKAAFELLDRRANTYSDRPRFIVGNEILCGGLFTATMRYGDVLV